MENRSASPSGTPAPYGRACLECSQSKCKCILRRIGGRCERCHRLNKDCRPSATVRRRNPRKSGTSKSARLEEKIDGLLSLLKPETQAQSNGGIVSAAANALTPTASYDSAYHSTVPTSNEKSPSGQTETESLVRAVGDRAREQSELTTAIGEDAVEPSLAEAEMCLTAFRVYKAKYFPFVHIPSSITAQQLRSERPFLWLSIMAITSTSVARQQELGNNLRAALAQEMLHTSGQSIDLLLGILAYIGWINYQKQSKASISVFTQLAVSLVYDLGLNKPIPKDLQLSLCIVSHKPPKALSVQQTMEERRAVLGCFLITSNISSFLQKIDALRWTPHMDECLRILDELKECPSDAVLVQQIRMQLVIERVGALGVAEHPKMPMSFYLQSLRSQLREVGRVAPPQLQQDGVVHAHFYATELAINEVGLSHMPIVANHPDFEQLECLHACVGSIKSWFEVFFDIPPAAYVGFPFSIFSQLVKCLVTLYRLSTLTDLAWDKDGVRRTADLLSIMDHVISNMERASTQAGYSDNNNGTETEDVFFRTAKTFRSMRSAWEANVRPMDSLAISTATPTDLPHQEDGLPFSDPFPVELSNDDWMMDFLMAPNHSGGL